MNSRDVILGRVRRNQPAGRGLPAVPAFASVAYHPTADATADPTADATAGRPVDAPVDGPVDVWTAFGAALVRMGGKLSEAPAAAGLDAAVRALFPDAAVICSATPEVAGTRDIASVTHPAELADVDVGVVRAVFGVAETGSVWLSEREFVVNAIGFLPQHLVVLLDPQAIVPNLHDAYHHPGFRTARYCALMTGPSATADIEGVLIRGAQGIRTMTVIPVELPSAIATAHQDRRTA